MNTTEEIWLLVGIAGFVLFLENALSYILKMFWKRANENIVKWIVGLAIFGIAIGMLVTLSK